jgi:hypothetical protein
VKEKKYTHTEFLDTFFPLLKNDPEQMKKFGYPDFIPWDKPISDKEIEYIQQWLTLTNAVAYDMRRMIYACLKELIDSRGGNKNSTKADEIMVTILNCDKDMVMIQAGGLRNNLPVFLSQPIVLRDKDTCRISNLEMEVLNGTKKNS